jgi:outer membrane protein W
MNNYKYLLVALAFISLFKSNAQSLGASSSKHFEIGAYYPLIIGDKLENRFNEIYDGVIGVDFKYTFKKILFINLKVGSTFDLLKFDKDSQIEGSSIRLNPNVMIGLEISKIVRLEPYIGVGYSFVFDNGSIESSSWNTTWNDPAFNTNDESYSDSSQNIFYKIGINYKLFKLMYIDTHLHLVNVFNESDISEISGSQLKQAIFNIGIGIQF